MIEVMIVDDHPVVRAGLRALIGAQADLTVVAEAGDLKSAVDQVKVYRPQVVLMDLMLGSGPGGAETTAHLRALPDPPEVLVLTTFDTEADIVAALDAGARGYLLKDAPPDQLWAAVRATAAGQTTLSASVQATLVHRQMAGGPTVTDREVEVLGLLARGLGNRQLAKELHVSEATVKSHLAHIYAKLGVSTRAGAVAEAMRRRLV